MGQAHCVLPGGGGGAGVGGDQPSRCGAWRPKRTPDHSCPALHVPCTTISSKPRGPHLRIMGLPMRCPVMTAPPEAGALPPSLYSGKEPGSASSREK